MAKATDSKVPPRLSRECPHTCGALENYDIRGSVEILFFRHILA
ncbi:hypothetical protein BN903_77 [Halorubrum sp. AJ67]|nr:hypothetical protein BN903_77 [Halorubrum sp. AJ67]